MPSTSKLTIDDVFAGMGRGQTINSRHVFVKKYSVQLDVVNATATFVVGFTEGPIQIRAVKIISEADLDGHASNYWTFDLQDTGTDGTGTTSLCSFVTDTPTTDKLEAFVGRNIHSAVVPTSLAVGHGLKLVMTKASSAADFSGKFEVEYVAELV